MSAPEAQPSAEPSRSPVKPPGRSARGQGVEARTCGFCGHRDPRWNGLDGRGWGVRDGLPVCPDCMWMEPWNVEREAA